MPFDDRLYKVSGGVTIDLVTDEGTLSFTIYDGFLFDGRSGGKLVDWVIPNLGTQDEVVAWLVHDVSFYPDTVSFELANDLLYLLLRRSGMGRFRAGLVYRAVTIFGKNRKSETIESIEPMFKDNAYKYLFKW